MAQRSNQLLSWNKLRLVRSFSIFMVAILIFVSFSVYAENASAAALTTLSDTMTRLQKSEAANHDIKFRTPSGMSSGTMKVYFNASSFTSGTADFSDIDLWYGSSSAEVNGSCASNCTKATLAATAGAGAWGAAFATNDLTFSYPVSAGVAVGANDYVRVKIGTNAADGATGDQRITNPSTAGTKTISIDVGTGPVDTGKVAVVILDVDQVIINASVDPSITFSLSATSTDFGVLAPSVVDTAGTNIVLTVGTNAATGYTIAVKDAGNTTNPGLYNSAAAAIIGSADASFNATANLAVVASGYGIQASCTAGCTTGTHVESNFRQAADTVGGLTLAGATLATFASTLSADHTIQIVHKAKSASTTPAGAYVDTITYIATGNF